MQVAWSGDFAKVEFEGSADFSLISIGVNLKLRGAVFTGPVDFKGSRVKANAFMEETLFQNAIHLEQIDWQWINLIGAEWPGKDKCDSDKETRNQIWVDGMKYQSVTAADSKSESCKILVCFLKQANFSSDAYVNLENYFRQQGLTTQADDVLFARKIREGEMPENSSWERTRNVVLHYLVGYGARPERSMLALVPVIIFAPLFFRKCRMMPRDNKSEQPYCALLYSLDVFLPGSILQMEKDWRVKTIGTGQTYWLRFKLVSSWCVYILLKLLGWIIVPIASLAVVGIGKL